MRQLGKIVEGFVFVAVEKQPPYGVAVYELSPEDITVGRAMYRQDLHTYAACQDANKWPAYPEDIRLLELPAWGRKGKIS